MKGPTQVKKPFACSFCDKTFSEKSKVKRHEGTHTGEKPFACSFCNKIFRENSKRKRHERNHTGEEPFACSFCEKKIFRKVKHEMTHTGEKTLSMSFMCHYVLFLFRFLPQKEHAKSFPPEPFSYSFCGKAFTQKSDIMTHERAHTGEKPFACSFCDKTFSEKIKSEEA